MRPFKTNIVRRQLLILGVFTAFGVLMSAGVSKADTDAPPGTAYYVMWRGNDGPWGWNSHLSTYEAAKQVADRLQAANEAFYTSFETKVELHRVGQWGPE